MNRPEFFGILAFAPMLAAQRAARPAEQRARALLQYVPQGCIALVARAPADTIHLPEAIGVNDEVCHGCADGCPRINAGPGEYGNCDGSGTISARHRWLFLSKRPHRHREIGFISQRMQPRSLERPVAVIRFDAIAISPCSCTYLLDWEPAL